MPAKLKKEPAPLPPAQPEEIVEGDRLPGERRAVVLIILGCFLIPMPMNMLAPNLTACAQSLGLSEEERDQYLGGFLSLACFVVGSSVGSLICGILADLIPRKMLYAAISLMACGGATGTVFSHDFNQLLCARILTGVAMGAEQPVRLALLGDFVPKSRIGGVIGATSLAGLFGVGGGQNFAGFAHFLSWSNLFLVPAAGLALFTVLVVMFMPAMAHHDGDDGQDAESPEDEKQPLVAKKASTSTTPRTGSRIAAPGTGPRKTGARRTSSPSKGWALVRARRKSIHKPVNHKETHFAEAVPHDHQHDEHKHHHTMWYEAPTLWLILFYNLLTAIPCGVINTFFLDYLSANCGIPTGDAAFCALGLGIGMALGGIVGTAIGQCLYKNCSNRCLRVRPLYVAATVALCIWPYNHMWRCLWVVEDADGGKKVGWAMLACSFIAGFIASQADPNVKAMLQNVTPPTQRGTVWAIFGVVGSIGYGLGPNLAAYLSAYLNSRSGAMHYCTWIWVPAALMIFATDFTIAKDEAHAED